MQYTRLNATAILRTNLIAEMHLDELQSINYHGYLDFLQRAGVDTENMDSIFMFDNAGYRVESRADFEAMLSNDRAPLRIFSFVNSSLYA